MCSVLLPQMHIDPGHGEPGQMDFITPERDEANHRGCVDSQREAGDTVSRKLRYEENVSCEPGLDCGKTFRQSRHFETRRRSSGIYS